MLGDQSLAHPGKRGIPQEGCGLQHLADRLIRGGWSQDLPPAGHQVAGRAPRLAASGDGAFGVEQVAQEAPKGNLQIG